VLHAAASAQTFVTALKERSMQQSLDNFLGRMFWVVLVLSLLLILVVYSFLNVSHRALRALLAALRKSSPPNSPTQAPQNPLATSSPALRKTR